MTMINGGKNGVIWKKKKIGSCSMIMDHSVIVIAQNTKIDCENNFGLKKD